MTAATAHSPSAPHSLPLAIAEGFEAIAYQILSDACRQGGSREDWSAAKTTLQRLGAVASDIGAEAVARQARDMLGQVEICIQRPAEETARLLAGGFLKDFPKNRE